MVIQLMFFFIKKILILLIQVVFKIYYLLVRVEWKIGRDIEFYDHIADFSNLFKKKDGDFLKRGVFNSFYIKKGASVLEIGCGDGFYTRFFYSTNSSLIDAVDYNKGAIEHSLFFWSTKKINFFNGDVLIEDFWKNLNKKYDNVICDAVLDRFNNQELDFVLTRICEQLENAGCFTGYLTKKNTYLTESIFETSLDVITKLEKYFNDVHVFEVDSSERVGFYFIGKKAN